MAASPNPSQPGMLSASRDVASRYHFSPCPTLLVTALARNLAASAVTNSVGQGLKWYREATSLDADNMPGWLGLGDAAMAAGTLQEADQGFLKYIEIARSSRN